MVAIATKFAVGLSGSEHIQMNVNIYALQKWSQLRLNLQWQIGTCFSLMKIGNCTIPHFHQAKIECLCGACENLIAKRLFV